MEMPENFNEVHFVSRVEVSRDFKWLSIFISPKHSNICPFHYMSKLSDQRERSGKTNQIHMHSD